MTHPVEAPGVGLYDGACTLETPSKADQVIMPTEQLSWGEARLKAEALVKLMNLTEKRMLVAGIGWGEHYNNYPHWYIGNTAPIPRLGIPSLKMQDSAGGFRTTTSDIVGTVTAWPCLLAMTATWDPAAVWAYSAAIGEEFVGKGANVLLGPSVDLHRVARGGRNFEFMSGDDPFLGSAMARAYVGGAQSHDLIAVAKHWIFNNQETHRGSESSNVDLQAAWELYYPPFEAAVDAGVDGFMCSYNKASGEEACSSPEQYRVLKDQMGFKGFVQSDWWASKFDELGGGLDQDMPGNDINISEESDDDYMDRVNWDAVDESVVRILAAMYRARIMNKTTCSPPNCTDTILKNVTSPFHTALARRLAAESIVLLKNDNQTLPLSASTTKSIAIVGAVADAAAFDPNGMGQGGNVESTEGDNVTAANAWRIGDFYSGGGSGHMVAAHPVSALEGLRRRAEALGIAVLVSATDDVAAGAAVARQADVAIVVGGAWGGEAKDRRNLSLAGGGDEIVAAVAAANPRTVVALQIPGAVVMPWRDSVPAIAALFLGGQETGNAWADVLFGDVAPSGRLPIMMPATERDQILPGLGVDVSYSEGLATGYRSPSFVAAFQFGHGLTYTSFEYSAPEVFACGKDSCVEAKVRNTGGVPARAVAQLYIRFPEASGHPAPVLKGFEKTPVILPGEAVTARFRLTDRDLSWYGRKEGRFVKALAATALIGESFADIRVQVPLDLIPHRPGWGPAIFLMMLLVCLVAAMVMVITDQRLCDKRKKEDSRLISMYGEFKDEESIYSSE